MDSGQEALGTFLLLCDKFYLGKRVIEDVESLQHSNPTDKGVMLRTAGPTWPHLFGGLCRLTYRSLFLLFCNYKLNRFLILEGDAEALPERRYLNYF